MIPVLTAPAGSTVIMTCVNNDTNIPHNFTLYADSSFMANIFAGEIIPLPKTITYTCTLQPKHDNFFTVRYPSRADDRDLHPDLKADSPPPDFPAITTGEAYVLIGLNTSNGE